MKNESKGDGSAVFISLSGANEVYPIYCQDASSVMRTYDQAQSRGASVVLTYSGIGPQAMEDIETVCRQHGSSRSGSLKQMLDIALR